MCLSYLFTRKKKRKTYKLSGVVCAAPIPFMLDGDAGKGLNGDIALEGCHDLVCRAVEPQLPVHFLVPTLCQHLSPEEKKKNKSKNRRERERERERDREQEESGKRAGREQEESRKSGKRKRKEI